MAEDFDLGGFDEAYSPDDFSQQEMDLASAIGAQTGGFGDDNTAQTIANLVAQPQVGLNRSNIIGSSTYDPTFSQAFDISRGLLPSYYGALPASQGGGMGFMGPTQAFDQGLQRLALPSNLVPQIEGKLGSKGPKYFSEAARIAQEVVPEYMQIGIAPIMGRFLDNIFNQTGVKEAKEYAKNPFGGLSLNDIKQGFSNFIEKFTPTDTSQKNVETVPMGIAGFLPSTEKKSIEQAVKELQLVPKNRDFFSTTTPNVVVPGFKSKAMSREEFDRKKAQLQLMGGNNDPRNIYLNEKEQENFLGRVINPNEFLGVKNMPFRNVATEGGMEDFNIFDALKKSEREESLYGRPIKYYETEV